MRPNLSARSRAIHHFISCAAVAVLAAVVLVSCGGGRSGGGSGGPGGGRGLSSPQALAAKLGTPNRLLIGVGGGAEPASIAAQGLRPDIFDRYLTDLGPTGWQDWNSPSGAYVNVVTDQARAMGAVPMFTLYQMRTHGDGNLAPLRDPSFMTAYWANVRLMFQRLSVFDNPAIVVVEPDFWGYVQQQSPGGDPRLLTALVTIDADCAGQPDDATGIASCIIQMARKYAPKAVVGFRPSLWGGSSAADVAAFMRVVGAQHGDFVAVETSDRDAGCFEALDPECIRAGSGWYWGENEFRAHFAEARIYFDTIGLPLIWWQTPFGVPSATPGGTPGHYRDNRMERFLSNPAELTAVGGVGVVFSAGEVSQTKLDTDGGQFKRLSEAYFASPVRLN